MSNPFGLVNRLARPLINVPGDANARTPPRDLDSAASFTPARR